MIEILIYTVYVLAHEVILKSISHKQGLSPDAVFGMVPQAQRNCILLC